VLTNAVSQVQQANTKGGATGATGDQAGLTDLAYQVSVLSAINRLIVAEERVPVERRYSFPVGIFTREVKAPRSSSDLGKGQRRERDPHGHDTGYLTFPARRLPRS